MQVNDMTDGGLRVLRFLAAGAASVRQAAGAGKMILEASGRGAVAVDAALLSMLAARGILARSSHSVALSAQGLSLARQLVLVPAPRNRDGQIGLTGIEADSGPSVALANLAESPLAQLARRKGKDGLPFLDEKEFGAGERLRADYTRGLIMPRLGANWEASVASGRRSGSGGGIAGLTDAALAARQRVENAVADVGPELSGVLIDVCCFLKGLEQVETERRWPVRSAKVVLKTALGALARHYAPPAPSGRRKPVLHWGAEDYRPTIS
jgi:hypothetical protein